MTTPLERLLPWTPDQVRDLLPLDELLDWSGFDLLPETTDDAEILRALGLDPDQSPKP